jgi:hypothetical protein
MTDEAWPMIEEAVFRLFDEISTDHPDEHVAIGPRLAELGWSDIEAEYPIEACTLLFRAQGRSLADTDCLARVMLRELEALLDEPTDGIVLPELSAGYAPSSDNERVAGIVLGSLAGRLVVPVSGPTGAVSVGVVDASRMDGERLDTFDASVHWTRVNGTLDATLVDASAQWDRAIAAAHQALATELVALTDEVLRIAVGPRKSAGAVRCADRVVPIAAPCTRRGFRRPGGRPRAARRVAARWRSAVGAHRQGSSRARASGGQRRGVTSLRSDRPDRRTRSAPLRRERIPDRRVVRIAPPTRGAALRAAVRLCPRPRATRDQCVKLAMTFITDAAAPHRNWQRVG